VEFSFLFYIVFAITALWLTKPLTEMSTMKFPGVKARPASKVDNLNAIRELQPHKVFTLFSRRDITEHSSTLPRFSTHKLLIVFECMYIGCK
jgi:hypothetical protein